MYKGLRRGNAYIEHMHEVLWEKDGLWCTKSYAGQKCITSMGPPQIELLLFCRQDGKTVIKMEDLKAEAQEEIKKSEGTARPAGMYI